MAKFGYYASHEQFKPSALLEYVLTFNSLQTTLILRQ